MQIEWFNFVSTASKIERSQLRAVVCCWHRRRKEKDHGARKGTAIKIGHFLCLTFLHFFSALKYNMYVPAVGKIGKANGNSLTCRHEASICRVNKASFETSSYFIFLDDAWSFNFGILSSLLCRLIRIFLKYGILSRKVTLYYIYGNFS